VINVTAPGKFTFTRSLWPKAVFLAVTDFGSSSSETYFTWTYSALEAPVVMNPLFPALEATVVMSPDCLVCDRKEQPEEPKFAHFIMLGILVFAES
jgi:hypothetical protein